MRRFILLRTLLSCRGFSEISDQNEDEILYLNDPTLDAHESQIMPLSMAYKIIF